MIRLSPDARFTAI